MIRLLAGIGAGPRAAFDASRSRTTALGLRREEWRLLQRIVSRDWPTHEAALNPSDCMVQRVAVVDTSAGASDHRRWHPATQVCIVLLFQVVTNKCLD